MKLVNGKLFITVADWEEAGLSAQTVSSALGRQSPSWELMKDPADKRKTLIGYEALRTQYKEAIVKRWGNPYDNLARLPIAAMIEHNTVAENFFLSQHKPRRLPIKRVKQYTRAIGYLELVLKVSSDKKIIKDLGLNIPEFYTHLKALIEQDKVNGASSSYEGSDQVHKDFPASYIRLKQKADEYKEKGYSIIIDKMYGNSLAAKVNDELAETRLLNLIENPNQYDDVLVTMMYNLWATQAGYKPINPATVGVHRRKKAAQITVGRYGNNAFNEKFVREVKGMRPSSPLYLVEHDDNNLDLLFRDETGYVYNKYVAIVVTDSYNDLPLGYSSAMAQIPEPWQVRHAYLDAMYYIRSLTGGWYMPFEIKADRWQIKELSPFYSKVGKFAKPRAGNKHRGYIEQFFGSPHWKRCMSLGANNYSGNNITSRHTGVNTEALHLARKERPLVGIEAEQQIEAFFARLRQMPDFKRSNMAAPSKEQQWLEAFNSLPYEKKRPITDEQMLLTFGIKHEPDGRTIRISNRGVEPQINGVKYSFDLPNSVNSLQLIGAAVNVVYDPYDMSRVLVTNGDDIRFIANTAQLQPRALKDAYTGSRTYLNALLAEKQAQGDAVYEAAARRKEKLASMPTYFNAEATLQAGVLVKELKNMAESTILNNDGSGDWNPLNLM